MQTYVENPVNGICSKTSCFSILRAVMVSVSLSKNLYCTTQMDILWNACIVLMFQLPIKGGKMLKKSRGLLETTKKKRLFRSKEKATAVFREKLTHSSFIFSIGLWWTSMTWGYCKNLARDHNHMPYPTSTCPISLPPFTPISSHHPSFPSDIC